MPAEPELLHRPITFFKPPKEGAAIIRVPPHAQEA